MKENERKLVMGKQLAEICDTVKGKTWKSIEWRQWQNFEIYLSFLNDSLFPKLQEYNQFHNYNVSSTKNFQLLNFVSL